MRVKYHERLLDEILDVEIPETRDDAFDLQRDLHALLLSDPAAWKMAVRRHTATCWYTMALFLSGSQRRDPFTGRLEIDCDFQFAFAREMQFDGDNVIDKSAREHFKTFWRVYAGVTVEVCRDPNLLVGLFSHEKSAGERPLRRNKEEWEGNVELKMAWDDVFWWEPEREAPVWSVEKGLKLRQTIVSATPTFAAYAIGQLPVGARLGLGILDDVEVKATSHSEEARAKLWDQVQNTFNLGGRAARWWINGTHHHPQGLIAQLETQGGYRVRCHAAEDKTKPAPDIAALYDECGGYLPVRDEGKPPIKLAPEVRSVKLAGAPIFLHPLECAQKRLKQTAATYEMHNMGDPLGGQEHRLDPRWIRWYEAEPHEWARGANLYINIDASKGVNDPTVARVEACKVDGTISWVGGLRRKLAPSEFAPAIHHLAMTWVGIGRLVEIRIEIFGQAVWDHMLRTYFESLGQYVCNIVAVGRNQENRLREYEALEPLYRAGKRLYPQTGIWVFDENGERYNLVDYYIEKELKLFPLPATDDCLAADALLGEPVDVKKGIYALEFPEDEATIELRERSAYSRAMRPDDGASWMSEGF